MTTTVEPQALPDAGPCRWCPHGQWSHKRGKGGCRELECPCDKYLPPKVQPAPAPEPQPVDEPAVEFARPVGFASDIEQDERDALLGVAHPTLAEVEAEPEPVDEPQPEPVAVVADPAAQAEALRQVAEIDEQLAQPEPDGDEADPDAHLCGWSELAELAFAYVNAPEGSDVVGQRWYELEASVRHMQAMGRTGPRVRGPLAAEVEHYKGLATDRLIERDEAQADAKQAREALTDLRRALAEQEQHAARQLGARSAELAQVRAELDRVNAARQRAQEQLGQAVHSGLAAATRVLWRYDADQCDTCGFRTTVPGMNHAHPLKPVTVLVVERDPAEATAPADDTTKEN